MWGACVFSNVSTVLYCGSIDLELGRVRDRDIIPFIRTTFPLTTAYSLRIPPLHHKLTHLYSSESLTDYFPESEDGVRKIMLDLFGSPDTAELFFTNDVKVLIEVLHRNVIDRGEGDPVSSYLLCF